MPKIIDGRTLRDGIVTDLANQIKEEDLKIKLAIIIIGQDPAGAIYVRNKEKYCKAAGIEVDKYLLGASSSVGSIKSLIRRLNKDASVTGIILQNPVPWPLDYTLLADCIVPEKDVDGVAPENVAALYSNQETILPCTVRGILQLLDAYEVDLAGKKVAIVGRSKLVGKPLALAMTNRDATVTLCHSKTENLGAETKRADIVVMATGEPHLLTKKMVKPGVVVIDVGIYHQDKQIIGDVDYAGVAPLASIITPNPGGVGPMTVAGLLENLVDMAEAQKDKITK